jgi:hypothetical protein
MIREVMDELLSCVYCDFQSSSHHLLLKHIRSHENLPDFLVGCSVCGKSYRKWGSLRKHLHRDHKQIRCESEISEESTSQSHDMTASALHVNDDIALSSSQVTNNDVVLPSELSNKSQSALFLLKASHSLSLTHSGVDELCQSTQSFVESVASNIKHQVFLALQSKNVELTPDVQSHIATACNVDDLFNGLSTRATREAFYRNNLHFLVMRVVCIHIIIVILYLNRIQHL